MLIQPEGPNLPRELWTSAHVERALKDAFKAMPYVPIYAPRGNTLQSARHSQSITIFDIVAFSGTVLGERSEERKILLLWARAIGTGGQVGGSIAQYCDEREMHRSTFDRRRI